jgi:protein HOOK3
LRNLRGLLCGMTHYIVDVLGHSVTKTSVPDIHAIVKYYDITATLEMCRITIAIAMNCEGKKEIVRKIFTLDQTHQVYIMTAIKKVNLPSNYGKGIHN